MLKWGNLESVGKLHSMKGNPDTSGSYGITYRECGSKTYQKLGCPPRNGQ